MCTFALTPPADCSVNVAVPVTVEPLLDSIVALALLSSVFLEDGAWAVRTRITPAARARVVKVLPFIVSSFFRDDRRYGGQRTPAMNLPS
jgi:hypothetical protein